MIACKECVNKSFPFPKKNPEYIHRGRICKICENKFYIKEVIGFRYIIRFKKRYLVKLITMRRRSIKLIGRFQYVRNNQVT